MVKTTLSGMKVLAPKMGVVIALFLGSNAWSADLFETGSVAEIVQKIGIDIHVLAPIQQFIGDDGGILTFQYGKLVTEEAALNAEEPHCDVSTGMHPAVRNVMKSTSLIKGQVASVMIAGPDPKSPIANNLNLRGATELLDDSVIRTPTLKLEAIKAAPFGKVVQMLQVQCFHLQMNAKVSDINKILGADAPVVLRPGSLPMSLNNKVGTAPKPQAKTLTPAEKAELLKKIEADLLAKVTPVNGFASLPPEILDLPDTLFLSKSVTVDVPTEQIFGTLIQEGKSVGIWTTQGILQDSDQEIDPQLHSCLFVVDPAEAKGQKSMVISGGIYGLNSVGKSEDKIFRYWDFRVQAKVTPDSASVLRLQCPVETSVLEIHNSVLKGLGGLYFISNLPANPLDELQISPQ